MATITIFINKSKPKQVKNKTVYPLYMQFVNGRGTENRFKVSITSNGMPEYVPEDKFDKGRQEVRSSFTGSVEINTVLQKYRAVMTSLLRKYPRSSLPGREALKKELTTLLSRDKIAGHDSHGGGDEFGLQKQLYFDSLKKRKAAEGTITIYELIIDRFHEYLLSTTNQKNFFLGAIQPEHLENFIYYLSSMGKEIVTIKNNLVVVKVFLRHTYRKNKVALNPLTLEVTVSGKFKSVSDKPAIFLTEDEYERFCSCQVSSGLQLTKDIIIFLCNTGLRQSDKHIVISEIFNDVIIKNNKKTGNYAFIPLTADAKAILEKYNYQIPQIHRNSLNDNIKKIGKLAGIDTPTKVIRYKGGVKSEEIVPKYKVLSTKVGRKSVASNLISQDVSPEKIAQIFGTKQIFNVRPYIGVSQDRLKDAMSGLYQKKRDDK